MVSLPQEDMVAEAIRLSLVAKAIRWQHLRSHSRWLLLTLGHRLLLRVLRKFTVGGLRLQHQPKMEDRRALDRYLSTFPACATEVIALWLGARGVESAFSKYHLISHINHPLPVILKAIVRSLQLRRLEIVEKVFSVLQQQKIGKPQLVQGQASSAGNLAMSGVLVTARRNAMFLHKGGLRRFALTARRIVRLLHQGGLRGIAETARRLARFLHQPVVPE
jgi:hypothetical protein